MVRGTDPVTYCVTSRDPAGMRSARTYASPEASEVTVTLPTNAVFPLTVKVSVSADGFTPPIPTAPPEYVTEVPCWLHGLVEGLT